MANPTTNYGFVLPTSTDLVTDLPADFDIALQGVDTRLKALQPGTTLGDIAYSSATANTNTRLPIGSNGQVLAVSGGVPAWTTTADVTPLTTKGDLFTFTTVDARLAVGNNGETLVADSSTSTGLRYQSNFAAGKNKIINGDMNIWQRGTSFTPSAGAVIYTADRFFIVLPSGSTVSRQTFTPGTAPVAGYEGQFYMNVTNTANAQNYEAGQRIENGRTFAGQTVTLSFWARSTVGAQQLNTLIQQNFGTGGSPSTSVDATLISGTATYTPNSSWVRYTNTWSIPSVAGKTFGTNNDSYLLVRPFQYTATTTNTSLDIWGVQLEAGSVATAFQTATGTIQGELAACQRYFYLVASGSGQLIANGLYVSATQFSSLVPLPVTMRSTPTLSVVTGTDYYDTYNGGSDLLNSLTIFGAGTKVSGLFNNSEAAGTQYRPAYLETNNAAAFVAFSAEL